MMVISDRNSPEKSLLPNRVRSATIFPMTLRRSVLYSIGLTILPLVIGLIAFKPLPKMDGVEPASRGRDSDRFTTRREGDRWWLVDDSGRDFFSTGINCVLPKDGAVKPTSIGYDVTTETGFSADSWAAATAARIGSWGFNTVGSWSADEAYRSGMPFTVTMHLSSNWDLPRLFEDDYRRDMRRRAEEITARWCETKGLIGYFTDNELPWYGEHGWPTGGPNLLQRFGKLAPGMSGKRELVAFFRREYADDFAAFARNWGTDARGFDDLAEARDFRPLTPRAHYDAEVFAGFVAGEYARFVRDLVREFDTRHLLLGVRYAGTAPDSVIEAIGPFVDVVSLNYYRKSGHLSKAGLARIYRLSGEKPILITEFSFRAMENRSGDMNSGGADVTVPTQAERARRLATYIEELASLPFIVGYHWFQYFDQSPGGRSFDNENSNYGLLDIYDSEYVEVTGAFRELNARAPEWHRASEPLPALSDLTPLTVVSNPAVTSPLVVLSRSNPVAGPIGTWGDQENGARPEIREAGPWIRLEGAIGSGWGCGWTLPLAAEGASGRDLSGAETLVLRARVRSGLAFRVFLAEAGVAAPAAESFAGERGADGESYESPVLYGTGGWETYRVPLGRFGMRFVWGNQAGNGRIDAQAVNGFEIYTPPGGGDPMLEIESIGVE